MCVVQEQYQVPHRSTIILVCIKGNLLEGMYKKEILGEEGLRT